MKPEEVPKPNDKPVCWSCIYYGPGNGDDVNLGICRRNPPQANLIGRPNASPINLTIWPNVKNGVDWCGEWAGAK